MLKSPASLRLRLLASGGIFVLLALLSVGFALDRSFIQTTEKALAKRLDVYFYYALANLEVDASGKISFSGEINDPQLSLPGSGLYIQAATNTDSWQSPSAIAADLPLVPEILPGQSDYLTPTDRHSWYQLVNGVVWELDDGKEVAMRVMVLEHPAAAKQIISSFRNGLYRWLGSTTILLLLAQWLLIRWALDPLAEISDSVAAIEAGEASNLEGDFPDELQPLTENINLLLASEERNRKQFRHDLDALAHGLKTPLAIISASLESQAEGSFSEHDSIQSALDDMQELISRHLEVASLSTRKLHGQRVNIATQLERIKRSLKTIYPDVEISSQINRSLVFRGDERDLLELLGNLLENACKYGGGKVEINVGVSTDSSQLVFVIDDNGHGISTDQVDFILRRGVRGEQGTGPRADEQRKGHGLGLSIVQHLVLAYQGKLSINSSPLGGARITIKLPIV